MIRLTKTLAAALFTVLVVGGGARAESDDIVTALSHFFGQARPAPVAKSSKIRFGGPTSVPGGYYRMCAGNPELCRTRAGRVAAAPDGSVILTGDAMVRLNTINASVNSAIRPTYRDSWTPGEAEGDCKDYAMTKRQRLIDSGWPSSAVPVAIVRTSSGEKHLILVARTNQGDFVLDNLTHSVVPWSSASYSWEKIQSPHDGLAWVAVRAL